MSEYDFSGAREFFRAKTSFTTGVHELDRLVGSDSDPATFQVVDVRQPSDFARGHVPGAVNLPRHRWRKPRGLHRAANLYLYCYGPTCHLAAEAAVELLAQGYRVVEVEGGWETWLKDGYGVEVDAASA